MISKIKNRLGLNSHEFKKNRDWTLFLRFSTDNIPESATDTNISFKLHNPDTEFTPLIKFAADPTGDLLIEPDGPTGCINLKLSERHTFYYSLSPLGTIAELKINTGQHTS